MGYHMSYSPIISGKVSPGNSTTTPLAGGATFTGVWEEISQYATIELIGQADVPGTLYWQSSIDGITIDRQIALNDGTTGDFGIHGLVVISKYGRVVIINGATPQASMRVQIIYHPSAKISIPTSRLSSNISDFSDVLPTRSFLSGRTNSGLTKNVPVDQEGHLEVALHSPRLPFGSIHTEVMTPVFQVDAVYGVNTELVNTGAFGSGTVTTDDSLFCVSTGVTIFSTAFVQSKKRLRYRPGQGVIGRFTMKFSTPVANSYQVIGVGHAEDGVYFGYKDTDFGILHSYRGKRHVESLQITTGSSTAENVTVELNGNNYSVAVTNSGNIQRTVWEIAEGDYPGWDAYPDGDKVVFVNNNAGAKGGAYSLTATTAVGAFSNVQTGAAATEDFIPQTSWNGDRLDGTGSSGMVIDPTKGNVAEIGIQYLGFGTITFQVETVS
jgi:hypothetical protein